jgi:hypothetical protein
LPYDQLHPPLLFGQHPLAEKIVKAFHENLKHVGTDFLLSYIRQHFWITRGRELAKKVRRECAVCRRYRAQPCEQMMADLAESRLDFGTLPFTRTAVDLFGDWPISNPDGKKAGAFYTDPVREAIGSLMYLMAMTRWDIAYAVNQVAASVPEKGIGMPSKPFSHFIWNCSPWNLLWRKGYQ